MACRCELPTAGGRFCPDHRGSPLSLHSFVSALLLSRCESKTSLAASASRVRSFQSKNGHNLRLESSGIGPESAEARSAAPNGTRSTHRQQSSIAAAPAEKKFSAMPEHVAAISYQWLQTTAAEMAVELVADVEAAHRELHVVNYTSAAATVRYAQHSAVYHV